MEKVQRKNLFMVLLGCRPPGRNTEQHDVFFGIAENLKALVPVIRQSWPEAKGNIHIDAWRMVRSVDGYAIDISDKQTGVPRMQNSHELFFINLGGYREQEFDEFHYKLLVVAPDIDAAKATAKKTAFFKHMSVVRAPHTLNATAHIDDKFGVDVDDAFRLQDILPARFKQKYRVSIAAQKYSTDPDTLHLGYFRLIDL